MTILKAGHLKVKKFNCSYCSCEFEANELEYEIEKYSTPTIDINTVPVMLHYASISCICPCCNQLVLKSSSSYSEDAINDFLASYD